MQMYIRKLVIYILVLVAVLQVFPATAANTHATAEIFFDNFENGDAFWDYGDYRSMRITDGKMSSDVINSICSAVIKGETTKWNNFVMDTVFEISSNNGWFGIYIRGGTDAQIQLVIHKNGFYTVPAPMFGGNCAYSFEDGKQYLMRISTENETVNVKIKSADETEFAKSWTGIYNAFDSGVVGFGSYMARVKIDSVKISGQSTQPVYFENKFVTVPQGGSASVIPAVICDADSISYSCSGNTFTVDESGNVTASATGNGYGVLTATVTSGGKTYVAKCDLARTVPVVSLGVGKFCKMTVGDTKEISVNMQPTNATNKELVWEVDNPDAIELVGDTECSVGIRALAPAKNVRIIARSKDNPQIAYAEYVTVEGKPSEVKVQEFNLTGEMREIPYGMFGISMAMPLNHAATKEELTEYDRLHLPYMRDMKIQQLRMCFENYDCTTGNIAGTNRGYTYNVADIFAVANELDIPVNITLNEYYDSAEKIITLAKEIRKVTDKEICFGIWEECYDGRMANYSGWNVKTAKDYTDFLKEIYPQIKAEFPDGSVKIGATIIDYPSYLGFGNGVGTTVTDMCSTWNHRIAEAKDYYDAVAVHHYSGINDGSTKGTMEGFAIDAACLSDGITRQTEMFTGKEFWVNEWGDLPSRVFFSELQSTQARNQYMKSVGNAMGYLQRILEMTENEAVKMSAYHVYDDSLGFGTVQSVDGAVHKLPPYYMFSMVGDIFEKNSYIYSLDYSQDADLHYIKDMSSVRNVPAGTYTVETSLMNAWAFGDEKEINEAVFENASGYPVKAYIPGYSLKKVMSYGNGENPIPDLAVNGVDRMTDLPSYIPVPEFYENEEAAKWLVIPPYSVVRAKTVKTPSQIVWEVALEDDFSSGDLSKWISEGEFEITDEALAVNVFNRTIIPAETAGSENVSISFDLKGFMDNMFVRIYDTENPSDCFFVKAGDSLLYDTAQAWDGRNHDDKYWHNFGKGVPAEGSKSIKYEIKDGVLTQYVKENDGGEFGEEHIKGIYSWEREDSYLKRNKKYSFGFWCIGELPSANGYNKAKATIDNVVIKTGSIYTPEVTGTEKIVPVYKTVFEDDFSGDMSGWSGSTNRCSVTEDGALSLDGFNRTITPKAEIASESIEVQYDFYGTPECMYLEFYNTENPSEYFRIKTNNRHGYNTAQVTDFVTWHDFGVGIETNKWQTIKYKINDGLIEMYVKDVSQPEFIERNHLGGRPYSSIWYDSEDKNVSFLKKGVKYGVRIYMYNYTEGDLVLIDNVRISTAGEKVSEIAYADDTKMFELTEIRAEAETDSGYELTAKAVCGAKNRFRLYANGANVSGEAIFAVYENGKLVSTTTAKMEEVTDVTVYIPHGTKNPEIKIMVWENLQKCAPMIKVQKY